MWWCFWWMLKWTRDDDLVLEKLASVDCPVILAVNKIDLLANRDELLPRLQELSGKHTFEQVIPVSATKGDNVTALESAVETLLPQAPAMFPEDQVTDRSVRFLAAELVREKLFRKLGRDWTVWTDGGNRVVQERTRNNPYSCADLG